MILIKSGKFEHLEEMQKQGHLYMRTLNYYSSCEDISRRDSLETASHLEYLNPREYNLLTLTTGEGNEIKIKVSYSSIVTHSFDGYVYCMHLIDWGNFFDERPVQIDLKDDWILIITDVISFVERIKNACSKLNINFSNKKVEYRAFRFHNGDKNPFQKDVAYSKEHEYRFLFSVDSGKESLSIIVGNIEDISVLTKTRKGVNSFKLMNGSNIL